MWVPRESGGRWWLFRVEGPRSARRVLERSVVSYSNKKSARMDAAVWNEENRKAGSGS